MSNINMESMDHNQDTSSSIEDHETQKENNQNTNYNHAGKKRSRTMESTSGLYLDTVNRHVLDFDFEKLCSVSLSNLNVYGCLICGKYFQGRGPTSHAYYHSLQEDHHVFIQLQSRKVYVLPDGYLVKDNSFDDIKYIIQPTYTSEQVQNIDKNHPPHALDLNGKKYIPGYVGLNNIKANDYANVILQMLIHVPPIRDYFLLHVFEETLSNSTKSELLNRFGLLVRKMWNSKAFKGQVSPHELLQESSKMSNKKFKIFEQGDPMDFMIWLLNNLNIKLKQVQKNPLIQKLFQGKIEIDHKESGLKETKPFWFLSMDLPQPRLFADEFERSTVSQTAIETLLAKYDGETVSEGNKTLRIVETPQYLVLHYKRFTKNHFVKEKNRMIVNFGIDGIKIGNVKFKLIANIVHESSSTDALHGTYKIHIAATDKIWYELENLYIQTINMSQVFLSESYIQLWEKV